MSNLVSHRSGSSRGLYDAVWGDCPWDSIKAGAGHWVDEDFDKGGLLTSQTTIASLIGIGWSAFGSAGATQQFGDNSEIVLTETDNDQATSIFLEQHPFKFSLSNGPIWYETRLKINSVTTLEVGMICGFFDTTAFTAAVPLTATSAIADLNFVGFHKPEADTTTMDASYKADGVAAVVVNDGSITIAADTYVSLGLKFDPQMQTVKYYRNGVKLATHSYLTGATPGSNTDYKVVGGVKTAANGFPHDVQMGLGFGVICGTNNDAVLTIDRVRACQLDL